MSASFAYNGASVVRPVSIGTTLIDCHRMHPDYYITTTSSGSATSSYSKSLSNNGKKAQNGEKMHEVQGNFKALKIYAPNKASSTMLNDVLRT